MIFKRHSNLKYKFGNRHFWMEGYYASTVDLNTVTIQKYIRKQKSKIKLWTNLKLRNI